jgi:C_GCAxxG_C_C family probable redox protein
VRKADDAREIFEQGFNCAQAVLSTYAPELGLDTKIALKIASSFGGGMAGMGLTCGAVTGALMVLGLKYGRTLSNDIDAKERNYEQAREFVKRFKKRHGVTGCSELLGYDISTPEGKAIIEEKNLFNTLCPGFVKTAAEILDMFLD